MSMNVSMWTRASHHKLDFSVKCPRQTPMTPLAEQRARIAPCGNGFTHEVGGCQALGQSEPSSAKISNTNDIH